MNYNNLIISSIINTIKINLKIIFGDINKLFEEKEEIGIYEINEEFQLHKYKYKNINLIFNLLINLKKKKNIANNLNSNLI